MKIAVFKMDEVRHLGIVDEAAATVEPIGETDESGVTRLADGAPLVGDGNPIPLSRVRLEPPVPRPRRNIFCVGMNYAAHASEFKSGAPHTTGRGDVIPVYPIIFSKVPEAVIAPGEAVHVDPNVSTSIDYEAELSVIIGRGGRQIAAADAMDHVWGYTIGNDITARDLQLRHRQWLLAKAQDRFCPMGPWAVTRDALDPSDTRIRTWVNGELRQDGNTCDMIFDVPTLIESISAGITLYPGDIIMTGTPSGVGVGFDPPKFIGPGDEVVIEIDGIGRLQTPIALYEDASSAA